MKKVLFLPFCIKTTEQKNKRKKKITSLLKFNYIHSVFHKPSAPHSANIPTGLLPRTDHQFILARPAGSHAKLPWINRPIHYSNRKEGLLTFSCRTTDDSWRVKSAWVGLAVRGLRARSVIRTGYWGGSAGGWNSHWWRRNNDRDPWEGTELWTRGRKNNGHDLAARKKRRPRKDHGQTEESKQRTRSFYLFWICFKC